ncbi:MAG: hypothetical protein QM813_09275 [Verrucomicrobiota bacterium]
MSLIGSLFGSSELQTTGDQADSQLADMNQRDYAPGGRLYEKIKAQRGQAAADAAYLAVGGHLETGATGNVDAQIGEAFDEGLKEGAGNITGFVSGVFKFVGQAISAILLGIPLWAWAVATLGIWAWLGFPGMKAIRKKLA